MPLPCTTCRHAGPVVDARTTCRAPRSDALVGYQERIGEALDAEVVDGECPGWAPSAMVVGGVMVNSMDQRADPVVSSDPGND